MIVIVVVVIARFIDDLAALASQVDIYRSLVIAEVEQIIDQTQQVVNGSVRLKLYKGNVIVVGRKSDSDSLFDESIATFEDDAGAYNQADAEGFIRLNALRLKVAAKRKKS